MTEPVNNKKDSLKKINELKDIKETLQSCLGFIENIEKNIKNRKSK